MINESEGEELGEELGEGLDQPGVIQVSPQDKEAIERVRTFFTKKFLEAKMQCCGAVTYLGGSGSKKDLELRLQT